MIGYLTDVIRPLLWVITKISGHVKTFKDNNYKSMSFCLDKDKPLEKYKTIWINIEDSKNIKLNALPNYDDDDIYIYILYIYIYIYIYTCIHTQIYVHIYVILKKLCVFFLSIYFK